MEKENTFLYQSIRLSGRQRFFDLSIVYMLAVFGIFCVCIFLSVKEFLTGFPSGLLTLFAVAFSTMSGALAYSNFRYLLYGWKIWHDPSQAQFLTLIDEPFDVLCNQVEKEKGHSLLAGLKNVTLTDHFLYVKQKGYFELYRREDIRGLELDRASGQVLCMTDCNGSHRELTRFWDDEAVEELLRLLEISDKSAG